jgi:DNA sulfur modification protein DndC
MEKNTKSSVFTHKTVDQIYDEIKDVYIKFPHPWVIGYSGGKDSTATIQVIWNALLRVPIEQRTKPIYVISTDTLVETPVIVNYIHNSLQLMEEAAKEVGIPLTTHKLSPEIPDTFWVNLIGKGYPAPNSTFRWCTDRMKIKPSNKFILNKVAEHGEVILALGMRKGESNNRDKVIKKYEVQGYKLSRHGQLPGSWVYMPIEEFTADDVWTYLIQSGNGQSPWGSNNRDLASLYRSAQAGECPLVIDTTTSSCGNSRFGCWTCTVVAKDKSMEAMIDSGEEWLTPLLNYRDWLSETQNPEVKPEQREHIGRDGKIKLNVNGSVKYRTYKLEFSKKMLKKLLETQVEVQKHDPNFELINVAELNEIRRIWISERNDWKDSLPSIYSEVLQKQMPTSFSDVVLPTAEELEILSELADKHNVPLRLMQKLIDAEWQNYGLFRRASIHSNIDKILSEDWRSLEDIHLEITRAQEEEI